jgi:hypothetical protein
MPRWARPIGDVAGTVSEDVAGIVELIARGEPEAGIKAAVERAKRKAETIFPMKPESRSRKKDEALLSVARKADC